MKIQVPELALRSSWISRWPGTGLISQRNTFWCMDDSGRYSKQDMISQPGLTLLWVRTDVYNPSLDFVGGISGADHVGCPDNGSCQFCEATNWKRHDYEPLLDHLSSGTALQHSDSHSHTIICLWYKHASLILLVLMINIFVFSSIKAHQIISFDTSLRMPNRFVKWKPFKICSALWIS